MEDKPCTHGQLISRVVAIEAGLIALKELLTERDERYKQRASSQDDAVRSALETSEKAITKAESATEKRFEGVNEFRQTLADQAATLLPRSEYNAQHKALEEKVDLVRADVSSIMARGGGIKEAWGYIIAISSAVAALAVYLFTRGGH